jgi:beta-glucosidase
MSSYNYLNGTYIGTQRFIDYRPRDEWGFKGLVMTDWFAGYGGGFTGSNSPFMPNAVSDVHGQLLANDLLMLECQLKRSNN